MKTSKGIRRMVRCEVCGKAIGSSGIGTHMKMHRKLSEAPPAAPFDRSAPVACTVCGKTFKASGMGRHMAAHRSRGLAVVPSGPKVHPVVVKALSGAQSGPDGITTIEVTLAVLSKLSADGRVAIIDLPDIIDWMGHTDRMIRVVTQSGAASVRNAP